MKYDYTYTNEYNFALRKTKVIKEYYLYQTIK